MLCWPAMRAFLMLIAVALLVPLSAGAQTTSTGAINCVAYSTRTDERGETHWRLKNNCSLDVKVWYCHEGGTFSGKQCGDPTDDHMNKHQKYYTHDIPKVRPGAEDGNRFWGADNFYWAACTHAPDDRSPYPKIETNEQGDFACYSVSEWKEYGMDT